MDNSLLTFKEGEVVVFKDIRASLIKYTLCKKYGDNLIRISGSFRDSS